MEKLANIRIFTLEDDWRVLVGKTATANETLSLKIGKPRDFWFHVAGMPGSHVVATHPEHPAQCPRDVKRIAAGLAAYFSKARRGGKVAVHWTTCENVSKRRGSPKGEVQLQHYDTIMIEPLDPETLNRK